MLDHSLCWITILEVVLHGSIDAYCPHGVQAVSICQDLGFHGSGCPFSGKAVGGDGIPDPLYEGPAESHCGEGCCSEFCTPERMVVVQPHRVVEENGDVDDGQVCPLPCSDSQGQASNPHHMLPSM